MRTFRLSSLRTPRYLVAGVVSSMMLMMASTVAHAQNAAVSTTGDQSYTNGGFSLGFEFTVNTAVYVTDLGFFDIGQDGLGTTHEVGIYRNSDASLVAYSVLGPSSVLDGKWAYNSITPVLLNAGENYTITAVADSNNIDGYVATASSFSTDSAITFVKDRYAVGTTLTFPTASAGVPTGYFTPNFKLSSSVGSAVPEPGTAALVLPVLGVAGMLLVRRKK